MEIKEIKTEHYMEILWPSKDEKGEYKTTITRISERNPLLFYSGNNTRIMAGFRFFDVRKVVVSEDPEDIIVGERSNYSSMFYYGKRVNIEQMRSSSSLNGLVKQMETNGSKEAILCYCGCFITNPPVGSLTIDEYEHILKEEQEIPKKMNFKPQNEDK